MLNHLPGEHEHRPILRADLGRPIGYLRHDQEDELRAALIYAFGLLGGDPTPTR